MDIRGFPQLFYYPAAEEEPEKPGQEKEEQKIKVFKHQGERTLESLE